MTKNEAIAIINARLIDLDEACVLTVADIVQSMADDDEPLRELTADEMSLLERSKEDFEAGRTYSLEEARAVTEIDPASVRW